MEFLFDISKGVPDMHVDRAYEHGSEAGARKRVQKRAIERDFFYIFV